MNGMKLEIPRSKTAVGIYLLKKQSHSGATDDPMETPPKSKPPKLSLAWFLPKVIHTAYALGVCVLLLPALAVFMLFAVCGLGTLDCSPW
jgi:hypothetical protein